MRTSAVWTCVNKVAWSLAMMRPQSYRGQPGIAGQSTRTDAPPMLADPGADADMIAFTYMAWISLQLRGNVYGLILGRDRLGYPTQIELQHPDQMRVRKRADGTYEYKLRNEEIDERELWHKSIFRMPGSRVGMSVIQYAARTTRKMEAAEQFVSGFFEDGAHPSAILTNKNANKIGQEQAQKAKDSFMAAIRGTRAPLVMGGG